MLLSMSDKNKPEHEEEDADKVIRFPSLAQRDRLKREKSEQEAQWRKDFARQKKSAAKAQNPPFFNAGSIPPVTGTLAVLFVVIHVVMAVFFDEAMRMQITSMFGFIPGYFTGVLEWGWYAALGPVTYALLHGGWMHVGVNSVMMLAFGAFVEKEMGGRGFFLFFLFCSFGGALLTFLLSPQSVVPVIGASGGISGLFAAIMIVFYDRGMFGPMGQRLARYGVWPMLGFWLALMMFMGLIFGDLAWQAHVGGYIVGIAAILLMKKGLLKL